MIDPRFIPSFLKQFWMPMMIFKKDFYQKCEHPKQDDNYKIITYLVETFKRQNNFLIIIYPKIK
jgi:hypothetical protein